MLDKRMLDPRRPIGPPSKDDQLEQLIPYQQTLVMSPLLYATHAKQVAQLSGEQLIVTNKVCAAVKPDSVVASHFQQDCNACACLLVLQMQQVFSSQCNELPCMLCVSVSQPFGMLDSNSL